MPTSPIANSHNRNDSIPQSTGEDTRDRRASSEAAEGMGRLSLDDGHQHQHGREGLGSKLASKIVADSTQDHKTLQPVLHERIIHHETELITRQREVERHIHHVQHHVQPLVEEVHKPEQHYHQTEPRSHEYEEQANSPEDRAFFASLNKQHSTETHICEERQTIENGETVTTTVHYHVHNVIQPVIYRDRPVPSSCVKGCTKASEIKPVMDLLKKQHPDVDESTSGRPLQQGAGAAGAGTGTSPTNKASRRAQQAQKAQEAQMGVAR
ncbi:hypothetical protein BCR35DRAFT_336169 [Leucosporidium creatinivorum]|uniref:Allergen n=1 Tax=Leucosporidium creatinivorum TaxID=106004 RepID=A0A1Y2CKP9_9BASI|nr:hypothetical protein BCR35DRAFT_336169 [Leucosporidium creatinivorum]